MALTKLELFKPYRERRYVYINIEFISEVEVTSDSYKVYYQNSLVTIKKTNKAIKDLIVAANNA